MSTKRPLISHTHRAWLFVGLVFIYPLGKPVPLSYMNIKAHDYFFIGRGNNKGNIAQLTNIFKQ